MYVLFKSKGNATNAVLLTVPNNTMLIAQVRPQREPSTLHLSFFTRFEIRFSDFERRKLFWYDFLN